jgi:acetyl esterase
MRERKPIDAALRRFLDEQAAADAVMTDDALVGSRRALLVRALESRASIPGLPNDVDTREVAIRGALTARLYTPGRAAGPLPGVVYLHGGGWVAGSVATHDPFCRLLSEAAGVIVVSVEYRLAPEHPHPAALEDAIAAVQWAAGNAALWGGDASRLALGEDSAGGHLAAVTANRLCAAPQAPALRALLLLYPVTDHPSANHPSYTENAAGYGLEANLMRWFWRQYAPGVSANDPDVSPLRLHKVPPLPPALVATSEYDVLRDEGIAYAQKLQAAGVAVTHLHAPDMHHNFPVHPGTVARFPQSDAAFTRIAGWLRSTLAAAPSSLGRDVLARQPALDAC